MADIGFIGLGNMGGPMAANLHAAGHAVTGFDVVPEACAGVGAQGIRIASDLASVMAGAEIVITMLPAGVDVLEVYRRALAPAGTLWIDCSTIDVPSARAVHELARNARAEALDAPVSGGVGGARAGTLTFMVGGEERAFVRARPVLAAMGKRIIHCGGPGAGQAAKVCNNLLLGISMIGVAEAFVLAERLGLAAGSLFEVVSSSSGQCWSVTNYCPVPGLVPASPANNGFKPGFATKLMLKDLRLAASAAAEAGAASRLGTEAASMFARFSEAGHAEEDFSAIINFVRALPAAPDEISRNDP